MTRHSEHRASRQNARQHAILRRIQKKLLDRESLIQRNNFLQFANYITRFVGIYIFSRTLLRYVRLVLSQFRLLRIGNVGAP